MKIKTFRIGGIHPKANKLSTNAPITEIATPPVLTLFLSQGIGAPSRPVVKPGDAVHTGQLIAEAGSFVSATLHSPVNGTVKKIDSVKNAEGRPMPAIIIEHNPEDDFTPDYVYTDPDKLSPQDIIQRVRNAGIVGMGGAAFPTHVKLSVPDGEKAETVLVNGAECEPYLTCDDALMQVRPDAILRGTHILMRAVQVKQGIIGVEENKSEAITRLKSEQYKLLNTHLQDEYKDVRIETLKKKYPQGGEKQLIDACMKRQVQTGKLPISEGAIVDNVATVCAVCEAVELEKPLTHRIVCVTGPAVARPGNYLAPIGTPVSTLIEAAGGVPEGTGKIISGGPMMGRAICNLDAPITKGMGGILLLPEEESHRHEPEPCIRCAKCVDACPMGLEPYLIARLSANSLWEDTRQEHVMSCIECGSCMYVCPSYRPLLDYIRQAKRHK